MRTPMNTSWVSLGQTNTSLKVSASLPMSLENHSCPFISERVPHKGNPFSTWAFIFRATDLSQLWDWIEKKPCPYQKVFITAGGGKLGRSACPFSKKQMHVFSLLVTWPSVGKTLSHCSDMPDANATQFFALIKNVRVLTELWSPPGIGYHGSIKIPVPTPPHQHRVSQTSYLSCTVSYLPGCFASPPVWGSDCLPRDTSRF